MSSPQRRLRSAGNAFLEFTFVGIPLVFVLISIFEVSRVMWQYNTAAHAVREAVRFASVHGNDCAVAPNSCTQTIQQIAQVFSFYGAGVVPEDLQNIRFIYGEADETADYTCADLAAALDGSCADAGVYWPGPAPGQPANAGAFFTMPISISAEYHVRSAIAMFWPGSAPVSFGSFQLPVSSTEMINY